MSSFSKLKNGNPNIHSTGFLNTGDGVVRGNMGLKDQLMALTWINTNIKSFGGDPDRVTLFGESAGAASVHYHVLSPRSKGLFSKAIAQSGSPLNSWALYPDPEKQAKRFAAKFGCPVDNSKEMVDCLKTLDAVELVNAHYEMLLPLRDSITMFVPTIESPIDDQTFLSESPHILLKEGRFNKMPMMAGVNSEEGLLTSAVITANQTKMDQANEKWTWWLSKILNIPEDEQKAKLIRKFYFGNNKNIASKAFLSNYTNLFSDRFFMVANHQHAKLYSSHAPIRLYYYTHQGDFSLGRIMASSQGRFPLIVNVVIDMFSRWFQRTVMNENVPHMGTAHADELPLLFDFILGYDINRNHKDFELSANMVKLWVSFATNDESEIVTYSNLKWMPVSATDTKFTYLQIDTKPQLIDDPFRERVNFWESLSIPS
ncbi:hypothetical protein HA402_009313 [Bradysia odoriphaga]|nr:hypothetical protein HA402_009313 [Bradysia odoriphaga]